MPECPVCRREFDARFRVFTPPGGESYDTIECARRAGSAGVEAFLAPTLLPTIDLLPLGGPPADLPAPLFARSRRRLAAAVAIPLVASPAAVAAGLSLVAVGTATSVALWSPALESGGRVVAAPAPPAQVSESGDDSEEFVPPSITPVTGGAEPDAVSSEGVLSSDTPPTDGAPQVVSDVPEPAAPAQAGDPPPPPPEPDSAPTDPRTGPNPPSESSPPPPHDPSPPPPPPHDPSPPPPPPHDPSPPPPPPTGAAPHHPVTPPPSLTPPAPAPTREPSTPHPPPPPVASPPPPALNPHSEPSDARGNEPDGHKDEKAKQKPKPKPKPKLKPKPKPKPAPAPPPPPSAAPPPASEPSEEEEASHETDEAPGAPWWASDSAQGNDEERGNGNGNGNGNGKGKGKKP